MTFYVRHEWSQGTSLPTRVTLSTCNQCETLRVVDDLTLVHHYIRRASDPKARVLDVAPACISPASAFFKAPW